MTKLVSQVTLALLAVGAVSAASAGTMGNPVAVPAGINLIAPDSTGMWSFGVEGLWAISNNQDFQYAAVDTVDVASGTAKQNNKSVQGKNDWGIAANINYMFAGNSRDVNLQYTGVFFNNSDSTSTATGAIQGVFPMLATGADEAKGSSKEDLNRVDLTFGQLISIGDRVDLHPFAGVSFANLSVVNKATYNIEGVPDETVATFKGTSNFWGVGPSVGIDGAVHLGDGWSIVGRAGAALFVGELNSEFKDRTTTVTDLDGGFTSKQDNSVTVVPELDARLGVDYMYAFNPNTSMNIQVGYEVANYFNAINQDAIDSTFVNANNNASDFNYYGPYLRLQLNLA
jgi:hypothetical protein